MLLYDDDDDDSHDDSHDDSNDDVDDDDDNDFPVRPLPRSVNNFFDTFLDFFMSDPPPEV